MYIKKNIFRFLYLTLLIIFTFCQSKSETETIRKNQGLPASGQQTVQTKKTPYLVYKVVDGDTFWIIDQNQLETKIRLIGIDSPETRNTAKKKKGYYGTEAKEYLQTLIY